MTPDEKMAFALSDEGKRAAQDYLSRLNRMDAMIAFKLSQLDMLRAKSRSITQKLTVPSGSGNSDRIGEIAAQLVDLENELRDDYRALLEKRQEIRNTIRRVPNEAQRTVLEMRYLEAMPFFRIAMKLHYDERTIYRLHKKALSQTALYLIDTGLIEASSAG